MSMKARQEIGIS